MLDVYTIAGYIPMSRQLFDELRLGAMGPVYGPPLPVAMEMRRRLGGHPVGQYRRAS